MEEIITDDLQVAAWSVRLRRILRLGLCSLVKKSCGESALTVSTAEEGAAVHQEPSQLAAAQRDELFQGFVSARKETESRHTGVSIHTLSHYTVLLFIDLFLAVT